jgi:hypothetical protein
MRWTKPNLRGSLYSLLGASAPVSESAMVIRLEHIRQAMLDTLGDSIEDARCAITVRRIRFASDTVALWYLRGDLMAALARLHGEAQARDSIVGVTALFNGLLPGSMTARSTSLSG